MNTKMVRLFILGILALLPLEVFAEQYVSFNRMCIAEKKGDGYWFLNSKELKTRFPEVVAKATRDRFQWFLLQDNEIQAKVYDAMRDAVIDAPTEIFKQKITYCPLTDVNQKLAKTVSYKYRSQDRMCFCINEGNQMNCRAKNADLKATSPEKWILFFTEYGNGLPDRILQRVPRELEKVIPFMDEYIQPMSACKIAENSSNADFMKRYEQSLRK